MRPSPNLPFYGEGLNRKEVNTVCRVHLLLNCSCPERESNPYGHHWPRDFKSLVSTNSTIWAFAGAKVRIKMKNEK